MAQSQPVLAAEAAPFAGARVVARIRLLIIVAVFAALGYAVLMAASKGFCAGGVTGDGTYIDSAGNAIASAPPCVQLTLRPSFLVFAGIAAIVVVALTIVLRRARTETDAVRYLNRAAAAVAILAVASVVISQVWFMATPITEWDGSGAIFFPFPFGTVDVVRSTFP